MTVFFTLYKFNDKSNIGEAVFVDDIPSPPNLSIKLRQELELDGVKGIISSKDIPNGGVNLGAKIIFGSEPLFSEEIAQCVGDRLAFVVADTQKLAEFAANSAFVEYNIENLEPPILSVEDAVKKSSFFDVPPSYQPKNQIGDILKGMAEADHKIVSSKIHMKTMKLFVILDIMFKFSFE
ncbi:indole-3-acetaldehyde oxidase-like [Vicia villosa]|uniref:indole-3-acetaldehyde oxidase-like n=1 Tax=Vicia villosa TaxID=3911 RepID=UPI00273B3257|nr:indole-3-acetaldehyde oxidase-like [Vicia villosa]